MRITNGMMSNNAMLNINRNKRQLDKLFEQLNTGNRINRPSDDPIAAARILKFRSNLSRAEQYSNNVAQALSWMNVTESSIDSVEAMMQSIRDDIGSGAGGGNTLEQMKTQAGAIRQLLAQIGNTMNTEFGGRFVFSGFRTDVPPMFQTDRPNDSFQINQFFAPVDIETGYSIQNARPPEPMRSTPTNILKLPYRSAESLEMNIVGSDGLPVTPPLSITPTEFSKDDLIAYSPGPDEVNFIPETGELVLGENIAARIAALPRDQRLSVEYEKHGFSRGEPNPIVFFSTTNLNTGENFNMDNQSLEYMFGLRTIIPINTLAKDVLTDKMFADLTSLVNFIDSIQLSDEATVRAAFIAGGYTGDDLERRITDFITNEENNATQAVNKKFSNMLGSMNTHSANITKERADLGVRMSRLELMEDRLKDDRMLYEDMIEKNLGIDGYDEMARLSQYQALFEASLRTTATIGRLSLLNFI